MIKCKGLGTLFQLSLHLLLQILLQRYNIQWFGGFSADPNLDGMECFVTENQYFKSKKVKDQKAKVKGQRCLLTKGLQKSTEIDCGLL